MSFIPGPLRLRRENQRFFLNTNEVRGIQSIQFAYTIPSSPLVYIGQTGVAEIANGAYGGQASISTLIVKDDPFIDLTGDTPFNGYLYETKHKKALDSNSIDIGFTSGFLSTYSLTCGIGEIPKVDASISVFGNIGKIAPGDPTSNPLTSPGTAGTAGTSLVSTHYNTIQSSENKNFTLKIADPRSLSLSMDNFETNRLNNFSIDIDIARTPIYGLGEKSPIHVERNFPIPVTCSFQIDLDAHNMRSKTGYDHNTLRDFPCTEYTENLSLTFYDHYSDSEIISYNFTDLLLVSHSHAANINGNVVANLSYRALINKNKI